MTSKQDGFFSCWQNVDKDSADVTWAGKLFQIYGPTGQQQAKLGWRQLTAWWASLPDSQCQQTEEIGHGSIVYNTAAQIQPALLMVANEQRSHS